MFEMINSSAQKNHEYLNRINPYPYYSFIFRVLQQNLIAFLMTPNKNRVDEVRVHNHIMN